MARCVRAERQFVVATKIENQPLESRILQRKKYHLLRFSVVDDSLPLQITDSDIFLAYLEGVIIDLNYPLWYIFWPDC